MMRKVPLILSIFLLLISFQNVSAQEKQAKAKIVSCDGCRNPKVIYLAKPRYPNAARFRVSGKVEVQILIDEKGNVETAKVISGHPFFRPEAEKAALRSKFEPYKLLGKPVKVYSRIVYLFRI